jgi:hypothetical protein
MEVAMGANQFTENSISHLDLPRTSGVYMITDKASGIRYIGSSVDIRRRAAQHFAEMKVMRRDQPIYKSFSSTYEALGPRGFDISVLLLCDEENLLLYEAQCISILGDTVNRYKRSDGTEACSVEERRKKSHRTKALWATPEYREKAIAARKGKAYNKGYRCTLMQIENRKKAGRISNMKRKYGESWKEAYAQQYPEFMRDLDGY